MLGIHSGFRPNHPLVEIIKGKYSSMEVVDVSYDFMLKASKFPVKALVDVPASSLIDSSTPVREAVSMYSAALPTRHH